MEIRKLWSLLWQRRYLVLLILVAALSAGYLATPQTTRYSATAVLFVGEPNPSADLQIGQQEVAATFATMIPGYAVAQQAAQAAAIPRSVGQLVSETQASVVFGTSLIHVTVTDADPAVAQSAANAISNAFVNQVHRIYGPPSGSASSASIPATSVPTSVTVSVTQPALLPVVPNSTGLGRSMAIAGLFGLVAAVALVLLLKYLDLAVRTPEDLEQRLSLPVIGVIPRFPRLETQSSIFSPRIGRVPTASSGRRNNGRHYGNGQADPGEQTEAAGQSGPNGHLASSGNGGVRVRSESEVGE